MGNEEDKSDSEKSGVVYYDGDCPMCRAFSAFAGKDQAGPEFQDFRRSELPEEVSEENAEKFIHFRQADGSISRGAEGVLKILERRAGFAWVGRLSRLPGFMSIAELVYSFIAANRFFLFGPFVRLYWTKIVLAVGFLIPLWITRNLWFGESSRFYALTPIHPALPAIDYPFDHLLFGLMAGLLIVVCLASNPRPFIRAFLLFAVPYSLWDQSRWMPYNYQFAAMFFVLGMFRWQREPEEEEAYRRREEIIAPLSAIVLGIWFWSGLHKLSMRYIAVGFPWLLSPFTEHLPAGLSDYLPLLALLSTPIETGGALLLLFPRTRRLGVLLIAVMHLFILLTFGPFGLNFNHSVWSWNLTMIAFLFLFFWKNNRSGPKEILIGKKVWHRVLVVLFWVMPMFSYAGLWDDFLSHMLYSWTTKEAEIELKSPAVEAELPEEVRPWVTQLGKRRFIHVLDWSYSVFQSPPYHAHRVFRRVFEKLCAEVEHSEDLELQVFETPDWITGHSEIIRYSCPK